MFCLNNLKTIQDLSKYVHLEGLSDPRTSVASVVVAQYEFVFDCLGQGGGRGAAEIRLCSKRVGGVGWRSIFDVPGLTNTQKAIENCHL